jgi:D-alanyl-D-alanine carboxypeptidase
MKQSAAALLSALTIASANTDTVRDEIHAYVDRYAEAGLFSGVGLVGKDDHTVYEEAFGRADRAFQAPNSIETKFHVASVSNPITAVLILADQGELSLDDKVAKFVADFPNGDKIANSRRWVFSIDFSGYLFGSTVKS